MYYFAFLARNKTGFHHTDPITDIQVFEWKVFSESGEDGILQGIFSKIGTTNKFCVEFGAGDGIGCNTGLLITKLGWKGLQMDVREDVMHWVKRETVTAENINELFSTYQVPKEFDLLSIDVDFNDYWIWKALAGYSPRVVVIEYNASIPAHESKASVYDPNGVWDGTNYFGGSLKAMDELGKQKGYTLIGCNKKGVNAFFVRNDIVTGNMVSKTLFELYQPPQYGVRIQGKYVGHPASAKQMIDV